MRIVRMALVGAALAAPAVLHAPPAAAQYTSDVAPELDPNHVRYFGSARDEHGRRLPDVTVMIRSGQSTFVFVTNSEGRYRGAIPSAFAAGKIQPSCAKSGFQTVRVDKRPGVGQRTVQVDCALRRSPIAAAATRSVSR